MHKIWSVLKKKITFIAQIFSKLLSPKNVLTWMPESSCFTTYFGSQLVNGSKTLLKSAREHFYDYFPLISNKLSSVLRLLVGSEIVGPFSIRLTVDHKYSFHNWEKVLQQVQEQLFSKLKIFFQVFLHFWNLHKILSVLKKKITFIAQIFMKLLSPENVVSRIRESSCFRTPFGSQRVKWSETLLKSALRHFYGNFPLISTKLSCVLCLLVGSEILGPFSDMLTANQRCSFQNWEKFPQQGQPKFC